METGNLIDDMNKPAVTAESDLQCGNVRSPTGGGASPFKRQCLQAESSKAEYAVVTTIYQLPLEILSEILRDVILSTGDSSYFTLSLVCRWFRDVVTQEVFRKAAHLAWLDSVANWKNFSPVYRKELRRMYSIRECLQCRALFKSYPPGYRGRGRCGELLDFYSDVCTGFCSQDFFLRQETHWCVKFMEGKERMN
ncbi:uncharacterized protein LOC125249445 isoform X2 [Megalobrama amblycephala]|uniref:uncharacterized protein LOC125249445 isoform X2 n=1 Tax=Megalobrama amblycephala TaxID=75352 RepID=UPI002013CDD7|nr:uncharacterized protein LOC125249445 isoform X2 [Megalobrama amblycephala]